MIRAALVAFALVACGGNPQMPSAPSSDGELTLWKMCFSSEGWPAYPMPDGTPQCKNWEHVNWGDRVISYASLTDDAGAPERWNQYIGCTVFSKAKAANEAEAWIVMADPEEVRLGIAPFWKTDGKLEGVAYLYPASLDYEYDKVVFHELGHLLGLQHDLWDNDSIMYPHIREGVQQLPTSADLSALRKNYCR